MLKFVKKHAAIIVCVLVFGWLFCSWIDVITDDWGNAKHEPWNAFVLMSQLADSLDNDESVQDIRIEDATVVAKGNRWIEFATEDGNIWIANTDNPDYYFLQEKVCVKFDTMGTVDILDDEVIEIY